MNDDTYLSCKEDSRREAVRASSLYGLDYVEVSENQLILEVVFLGKAPAKIEKANIVIRGGQRITGITATNLRVTRSKDPDLDDHMEVTVNRPGDFSIYTLSLVKLDASGTPTAQPMDGFDPVFDEVNFTFKASCPTGLDCKAPHVCPPAPRTEPDINYLAKDFGSFRQLILDRLALIMPGWQETHIPDIGIALVELLAYVGDYLSYYQDSVATEAYLGTARQRISVRRHVRLVDYVMHEGCNARAWLTLKTDTDYQFTDASRIYFITAFPNAPVNTHVLAEDDLKNVNPTAYEVFQPLIPSSGPFSIYKNHSCIHFYTWGDCECCLAVGATSATLKDEWVQTPTQPPPSGTPAGGAQSEGTQSVGSQTASGSTPSATQPAASVAVEKTSSSSGNAAPSTAAKSSSTTASTTPASAATTSDGPPGTVRALNLKVGDVLIFKEVIGPDTGNPDDADPAHRQAVRLTSVTQAIDPLYHPDGTDFGQPIVKVEWAAEDALTFPLCISVMSQPPDCSCREDVSIALANVILVDNGKNTSESLGAVPTKTSTASCPTPCKPAEVQMTPGWFRPQLTNEPLTFSQPLPPDCSAASRLIQDPRQALPSITLTSTLTMPDGGVVTATWIPQPDLLESGLNDYVFVTEVDDDGYAHLRFGDGNLGRQPDATATFEAAYRIGNGTAGNVGAETITYLVLPDKLSGVTITPTNPMAATGGLDQELVAEVKKFAPYAFSTVLERAITGADYATIAADNARRLAQRCELTKCKPPAIPAGVTSPAQGESRLAGSNSFCCTPFEPLQNAKGVLRWNGSWYDAFVAVDPMRNEQADSELLDEITCYLEPFRRIGHDLSVAQAIYVSLDLEMTICVLPDYLRAQVELALLNVFSNRINSDGTIGFFYPDNLTFGQGLYVSRIVAAAQAVTGVQNVEVTTLARYLIGEPQIAQVPSGGVLTLGPFEIARLDNDPDFPEHGRLVLNIRGGR